MDFLKTLMLYMSLTFATSVQAVPTPEVTPVPTPAPAVVETATPAEDPMAAVTAALPTMQITAEPTQAPAPTITPNTRYTNVKQGQRGDNVKKLQKRLIELGYLEKGNADGVFGNQTRRALVAFQQANGLTADGIAGDATQTHLYENPDVITGELLATPTPEPTATPEATIAAPAEAEATATPEPTEVPLARTQLAGASIVYNDDTAPLMALRQKDGVTVANEPRVYQLEDGRIQLSLTDLADAIDGWDVNVDGNLISLHASGYVVTMMRISGSYSCVVDSETIVLAQGDVSMADGEPCVTADFLRKALGAEFIWDAEETTLILRILPKASAGTNG